MRRRGWMVGAAIAIGVSGAGAAFGSPCGKQGAQLIPRVKLEGGIEKRFPHLESVLTRMLVTLSTPELWDQGFWNGKVGLTGRFVNWRGRELAAQMRRYLTDRKLTLRFAPDPNAKSLRAAADTDSRNRINLHIRAGGWSDGKYRDYELAVTIFHELNHVFQY